MTHASRLSRVLTGLLLAAVPLRPAAAQDRVLLRGGVVAADGGERIPYAVVLLRPQFDQRFTDGEGTFTFLGLRPGSYGLLVRQIGYQPFDTVITVTGAPVSLRIELRRIAVQLAGLTVSPEAECLTPGPPGAGDPPALHTLFEQLRQNADRYRLLAEAYPFRYRVTRRITVERADGTSGSFPVDTLERRSDERRRYRPGRVADWGRGAQRRTRLIYLPELPDLADSNFQAVHCFRYAGVDTVAERALLRLEFRASAALRDPDVDGSVWLDPASYQLRQLTIRLTLPERAMRGVTALSATVTFREALPSLIVPELVTGLTTWAPGDAFVGQFEEQRLLTLEFRRRPGEGP